MGAVLTYHRSVRYVPWKTWWIWKTWRLNMLGLENDDDLAIPCDLFGMLNWLEIKGESWPPTIGDEQLTLNHLVRVCLCLPRFCSLEVPKTVKPVLFGGWWPSLHRKKWFETHFHQPLRHIVAKVGRNQGVRQENVCSFIRPGRHVLLVQDGTGLLKTP